MTPDGPRSRWLTLPPPCDDVTLHWLDWGDPESSRVVVCVHGLTRNAHDFDDLAPHLVAQGARVLAVDMVGRGGSSWLADKTQYVLPTYAAHMTALLAELGLAAVDWIGTSMGGLIGMLLAAGEQPPMRRLILNDIGPFVPREALLQIKTYVGQDRLFCDLDSVERHLRVVHAPFGNLPDAVWQRMAATSARRADGGWRLSYDPGIAVPYAELADDDVDLWPLWERIVCPTFVLRGEASVVLPPAVAEAMQVRGPKATVATVPGVGHAPALVGDAEIRMFYAGWSCNGVAPHIALLRYVVSGATMRAQAGGRSRHLSASPRRPQAGRPQHDDDPERGWDRPYRPDRAGLGPAVDAGAGRGPVEVVGADRDRAADDGGDPLVPALRTVRLQHLQALSR